MDLEYLLRWGLDYTKNRKKRWGIALGALGMSYGVYRVYHSPSMVNKRKRWSKMLGALVSVAEMMSDSAEAVSLVSKDVKQFLESDSDQIPNSLKQISKIARSHEFSESLTKITTALTLGISLGYYGQETVKKSDFSELVLDKLFSETGAGFASVVVGSLARNLVMAHYSNMEELKLKEMESDSDSDSVPGWVNVILEDKFREVIGDLVQVLVSTAVSVFLDKTMHINPYDELISGMTNPKHETRVKDMLSSLCNGAIETFVRTSHQTLMNNNRHTPTTTASDTATFDGNKVLVKRPLKNNQESGGWMRKMSSSLTAPNNRKLVLDVTGRVTFETVRCFLEYLLERMSECLKRGVDVIQGEVIDRGIVVVKQHVSRRPSAVVTLCLSLCFHILNSPWIFVSNY